MIVYVHKRLDTNKIFYVGIGKTKKRAYSRQKRNQYWKNIVSKYGYVVEIVAHFDTWEECCKLEKELITKYGRKDLGRGNLANMTDGGDGLINIIYTKERNDKISKSHKGKKLSQYTKNKLSNSRKGVSFSNEHKLKLSNAHSKAILLIQNGKVLKEYKSIKQAAKELNLHSNGISKVCKGEYSQTGGYVFKYKNDK